MCTYRNQWVQSRKQCVKVVAANQKLLLSSDIALVDFQSSKFIFCHNIVWWNVLKNQTAIFIWNKSKIVVYRKYLMYIAKKDMK